LLPQFDGSDEGLFIIETVLDWGNLKIEETEVTEEMILAAKRRKRHKTLVGFFDHGFSQIDTDERGVDFGPGNLSQKAAKGTKASFCILGSYSVVCIWGGAKKSPSIGFHSRP
jgi:hypothetical protein